MASHIPNASWRGMEMKSTLTFQAAQSMCSEQKSHPITAVPLCTERAPAVSRSEERNWALRSG